MWYPWTYEREVHRDLTPKSVFVPAHSSYQEHKITVMDRSSAHAAAWHLPKRPLEELGEHFKLDDCRVWLRLHFWACRSVGLFVTENPAVKNLDRVLPVSEEQMMMPPVSEENQRRFQEWYTQFLGHFIRVYERNAPPFVPYEVAWSDSEKRLQMYIEEVEKGSH